MSIPTVGVFCCCYFQVKGTSLDAKVSNKPVSFQVHDFTENAGNILRKTHKESSCGNLLSMSYYFNADIIMSSFVCKDKFSSSQGFSPRTRLYHKFVLLIHLYCVD